MSALQEVGAVAGWRCWLCDEFVDPEMSVNDPRGPSIDTGASNAKNAKSAKGKAKRGEPSDAIERLAHRSCNTGKGAVTPVVPWPDRFFVADPAPIIASVDRLSRKGGREVMGRCPTRPDAEEVAAWLVGRVSRLRPDLAVTCSVEPGGGQHLVILRADR